MRLHLRKRLASIRALGIRLAGPTLALGFAILLFSSTGHDDTHISLWSAHALAELGEIVNYSGDRVEQSSSLLQTVLLALVYKLTGLSLPTVAYVTSIVCALLAAVRLQTLAAVQGHSLAIGAATFVVSSPLFAYCALSGLETTLFAWCAVEFLIAACRVEQHGRWWALLACGAWATALAASRPEAGIVATAAAAASFAVAAAWGRKRRRFVDRVRGPATVLALAAVGFAVVTLFRLVYFGSLFPHPVLVKIGGTKLSVVLSSGLQYLIGLFARTDGAPLLAGFIAGILLAFRALRRGTAPLTSLFVCAYLGFIVTTGGDWMVGGRFLAHVIPLLALGLCEALAPVRRTMGAVACTALVAINLVGMLQLSMRYSTGRPLWVAWQVDEALKQQSEDFEFTWVERANTVHARDLLTVPYIHAIATKVLEHQDKVVVYSSQAGMVAYYLALDLHGKMEFHDRLGLTTAAYDDVRREFGIPTGRRGLGLAFRDFVTLARHREGSAYHPDVIFDVRVHRRAVAERAGYVVVYEQKGTQLGRYTPAPEEEEFPEDEESSVETDVTFEERLAERFARRKEDAEPRFFTTRMGVYQFVAVRKHLAKTLGLEPQKLNWDRARKPHLRYLFDDSE